MGPYQQPKHVFAVVIRLGKQIDEMLQDYPTFVLSSLQTLH